MYHQGDFKWYPPYPTLAYNRAEIKRVFYGVVAGKRKHVQQDCLDLSARFGKYAIASYLTLNPKPLV